MEEIDLIDIKENLKSYYLIKKIYDIHNDMRESEIEPVEYNLITTNLKLLNYISEINFVFIGNVGILDQIKEYKKVGNLLNLQVFLDPDQTEDKIVFHNDQRDKNYELIVKI